MYTLKLDIGNEKWNKPQERGIRGTTKVDRSLSPYIKYEYHNGESFTASQLLYNDVPLDFIIPESKKDAKRIITYFSSEKILLVVQIEVNDRCTYYVNKKVDKPIDDTAVFEDFVTVYSRSLEATELKEIMNRIKGRNFYYDALSEGLRNKLLRGADLIFDLRQKPPGEHTAKTSAYKYMNTTISLIKQDQGTKGFVSVAHRPRPRNFWVKSITGPDGHEITVDGGFTRETIETFKVYYGTNDFTYENPLVIVLTMSLDYKGSITRLSEKYLLSRNGARNVWESRRICGNVDSYRRNDFWEVLENISRYGRLKVEELSRDIQRQLVDITKNLTINFTKVYSPEGLYASNRATVHYRKDASPAGYSLVLHADTFPSFTVKRIRIRDGNELTGNKLPPTNTVFGRFAVYYDGKDYKTPVLIEMICTYKLVRGSSKIIYYYSKDENDKWVGYKLEVKVSIRDDGLEDHTATESFLRHVRCNKNNIRIGSLKNEVKQGKLDEYNPSPLDDSENGPEEEDEDYENYKQRGVSYSSSAIFGITSAVAIGIMLLVFAGRKLATVTKVYFVNRHVLL
ncbi:hypothetical protein BEWA_048470 [Theileria equi strain WA]|uniref:Uncharacterized protein n=1 Tax=Theileria equi strain WA TaxID=1537102 RepID=L1LAS5_THEEQ|nr:hypothetical protein BEWA_048470 [Theileria equi strain WA]EKX72380.1 hypothetical protein BEWA_048470 [Theileria equi strain WA]|eukprot:XP_004831832.1 hypothetical protein BEWA_048470 [Theileria equi strain WA]